MKKRVFLAAEISEEIRSRLVKIVKEFNINKNIKWVKGDNIHITIYFFGSVNNDIIKKINEIIGGCVEKYGEFEVTVRGIGAFPNLRRPRVIWAGVEDSSETLKKIYSDIYRAILNNKLDKTGVQVESRAYRPHLTLGRAKRIIDHLEVERISSKADNFFGKCWIDKVVLFSSQLQREGPIYTPIADFSLGGGDK